MDFEIKWVQGEYNKAADGNHKWGHCQLFKSGVRHQDESIRS